MYDNDDGVIVSVGASLIGLMLWLSVTVLSEYAEVPPRLLTSRVVPVVYEAPEPLSIRTAVRPGAAPL